MAALMPHVESFDVEDDRRWKANVKIPLGLGSLKMSIKFEKLEEREPEFSRLQAKGTGVGALMNLDTQFNLSEQDGATAMAWEADVRIAGPVGSMGQRVLQPIVNQQVQLVLTALDKQVAQVAGSRRRRGGPQHAGRGVVLGRPLNRASSSAAATSAGSARRRRSSGRASRRNEAFALMDARLGAGIHPVRHG